VISLFGLALPYLLLANLIVAIVWILLRKWYFIISVVILLIGWSHAGRHIAFHDEVELRGDQGYFSILSYNVHNLMSPEGNVPANQARKGIFGFLASQDCDIICLQEFKSPKRMHLKIYEEIKTATN
jgi:hypothetical protein